MGRRGVIWRRFCLARSACDWDDGNDLTNNDMNDDLAFGLRRRLGFVFGETTEYTRHSSPNSQLLPIIDRHIDPPATSSPIPAYLVLYAPCLSRLLDPYSNDEFALRSLRAACWIACAARCLVQRMTGLWSWVLRYVWALAGCGRLSRLGVVGWKCSVG